MTRTARRFFLLLAFVAFMLTTSCRREADQPQPADTGQVIQQPADTSSAADREYFQPIDAFDLDSEESDDVVHVIREPNRADLNFIHRYKLPEGMSVRATDFLVSLDSNTTTGAVGPPSFLLPILSTKSISGMEIDLPDTDSIETAYWIFSPFNSGPAGKTADRDLDSCAAFVGGELVGAGSFLLPVGAETLRSQYPTAAGQSGFIASLKVVWDTGRKAVKCTREASKKRSWFSKVKTWIKCVFFD